MLPVGSEPFLSVRQRDLDLAQFKRDFFSNAENVPADELCSLSKVLEDIFDSGGRILRGVFATNGVQRWPCITITTLPYIDFPSVDEPRTIKKYLLDQLVYIRTTPKTSTKIGEVEILALFQRSLRFS
jgi:hypothetical protein